MVGYLVATGFFMITKRVNRELIMVTGALIEVLGCFIIGPIIPVEEDILWVCGGMFVMGLGGALAYLPALPYMIKVSDKKFEDVNPG
jgi:fucose permease